MVGVQQRAFSSPRKDLLNVLQAELADNKDKSEFQNSTSFKLVSSNDNKLVLENEMDGYKVKLTADYAKLQIEYEDEDLDSFTRITNVPVKFEVTSPGSNMAMMIEGNIGKEKDMRGDDAEVPFFSPVSLKFADVGSACDENAYSPSMEELDESLQDAFVDWLAEFEIDRELFKYVLHTANEEEEDLYMKWLKNFHKVVEGKKA